MESKDEKAEDTSGGTFQNLGTVCPGLAVRCFCV